MAQFAHHRHMRWLGHSLAKRIVYLPNSATAKRCPSGGAAGDRANRDRAPVVALPGHRRG
jgi:hypothetical protein